MPAWHLHLLSTKIVLTTPAYTKHKQTSITTSRTVCCTFRLISILRQQCLRKLDTAVYVCNMSNDARRDSLQQEIDEFERGIRLYPLQVTNRIETMQRFLHDPELSYDRKMAFVLKCADIHKDNVDINSYGLIFSKATAIADYYYVI